MRNMTQGGSILLLVLFLLASTGLLQAQNPPQDLVANVAGTNVDLFWDAPDLSQTFELEGTVGADGGIIRADNGGLRFVIPPGGLADGTRIRVGPVPSADMEAELAARNYQASGTILEGAALLEIESSNIGLQARIQIKTPDGITPSDRVVFRQLTGNEVRYWSTGRFSQDGNYITASIPINAEDGLPRGDAAGKRQSSFLQEIQANGVDDDADGLVDEMELYVFPEYVADGVCDVSGSVLFEDGTPANSARISVPGSDGTPAVTIADDFGNYALPVQAQAAPGFITFTVAAKAVDGNGTVIDGLASGLCSVGENTVVNVTLGSTAGAGVGVDITSHPDSSMVTSPEVTLEGTVNDPTVSQVEILINGIYPPLTVPVNGGRFRAGLVMAYPQNYVVVKAETPTGGVGASAVLVEVEGQTEPADIQVLLGWDKANDVDLYVVTPSGEVIFYRNPRADGGFLSLDRTDGTSEGPEVINFAGGEALTGHYGVAVQFFDDEGQGRTEATITVIVKGQVLGTFVRSLSSSRELGIAPTLENIQSAAVWNVASFDFPDGNLVPERSLAEYDISSANFKRGIGKDAGFVFSDAEVGAYHPVEKRTGTSGEVEVQMYKVYRSTTPNARANGTMIASVDPSSNHYSDQQVADGTYYYQVVALYGDDESHPSNEIIQIVDSRNRPPTLDNTIANQTMVRDGGQFRQDLTSIFSDPDGNPLRYTVTNTVPTVAGAVVRGNQLTVIPLDLGNSVITVKADDGRGGTVSTVFTVSIATAVANEETGVPQSFALHQNYPNPFNPETRIQYDLAQPGPVRIDLFDLLGRHIQTLVDAGRSAGSYAVRWDGRSNAGEPMPTGVYVFRMKTNSFEQSRTMLLIR